MALMRILYVENHSVFADNVTRQFLSRHVVTIVPSLRKARQMLSSDEFDLALIDYDLDDGKGDTLVREIRALGVSIAIVGVSSHDEGNAALREAGAGAICNKMQFDQIQGVIENTFAKPKTQGNE